MTQDEKTTVNAKLCSVLDDIMHFKSECQVGSDEHKVLVKLNTSVSQIAEEIHDMPTTQ